METVFIVLDYLKACFELIFFLNFSITHTMISCKYEECSAVYNNNWAKENPAEHTVLVLHDCLSQPFPGSGLGCSVHLLFEAGYVCLSLLCKYHIRLDMYE